MGFKKYGQSKSLGIVDPDQNKQEVKQTDKKDPKKDSKKSAPKTDR